MSYLFIIMTLLLRCIIAGVLLVAAVVSSYLPKKIIASWMWIGEKLGTVMSRVIISLVFIDFLTLIAILYQLL